MDSHEDDILGGKDNSPNIKSLADEQDREERIIAEQQAAAKKERETVAIDGVAFHENEIDYHSKNIKQKDNKDLFTNVEGAERRRREAEEEALKYAVTKKEARERLERDIKRAAAERAKSETRKSAEVKEITEKERSDQLEREKQRARLEAKSIQKEKARSRISKLRRHKKLVLLVLLVIIIIIGAAILIPYFINKVKTDNEQRLAAEAAVIEKTLNFEGKLEEAAYLIDNNRIKEAMPIYEELLKEDLSNEDRIKVYIHRSMTIHKSADYSKTHHKQVMEDANAAYQIDNNSTRALAWLIELYSELGENSKAKEYQERYDEIMNQSAEEAKKNNPNDSGRG